MKPDKIVELAVRRSSADEVIGVMNDPKTSNRRARKLAGELYRSGKVQKGDVQAQVQKIMHRRRGSRYEPPTEPDTGPKEMCW